MYFFSAIYFLDERFTERGRDGRWVEGKERDRERERGEREKLFSKNIIEPLAQPSEADRKYDRKELERAQALYTIEGQGQYSCDSKKDKQESMRFRCLMSRGEASQSSSVTARAGET